MMVAELVPMPAPSSDLLRVNRFFKFEEGERRLLFVVENAAFLETDPPAWMLAELVEGKERVRKSEVLHVLAETFGEEEAKATLEAFEKVIVLEPWGQPKMKP